MSYKSPSLKISEIVVALNEIGFHVTENDFRKSEPKRWREFYAKIFETLTSISIEVPIQHICQVSLFKIDHPELFEEGFSQMAFTLCMQRVLCSCGYEKFSVKNVIEPDSKMLARLGSAFVNTYRHNISRTLYFNELLDEIEYSKGEFDKILQRNIEVKEKLAKLKETNEKKEAEIAQCKEEEEKLKAQLDELQREPFLKDIEEIKHGMAEKNVLKEKWKKNLLDLQQECEKLSNKIVSSPERFKQDQERLRNRLQQLKAQVDANGKKLAQDRSLLNLAANKKIACEKLVKMVKEIQSDVRMAREGNEEVESYVEKAHELQEHHLSLLTQREDLEENIAVRQSQKQKILSKSDLNKQCGEQELADGIEQCAIYEKQLKKLHTEISAVTKKRSEAKENFKLEEREYEKRKTDLDAEFPKFYEEMDLLHYLATNGLDELKKTMMAND